MNVANLTKSTQDKRNGLPSLTFINAFLEVAKDAESNSKTNSVDS